MARISILDRKDIFCCIVTHLHRDMGVDILESSLATDGLKIAETADPVPQGLQVVFIAQQIHGIGMRGLEDMAFKDFFLANQLFIDQVLDDDFFSIWTGKLQEAKQEITQAKQSGAYSFFITNDDLDLAVAETVAVINQFKGSPASTS